MVSKPQNTKVHTYAEIGRSLQNWGYEVKQSQRELIADLSEGNRQTCLLAAMVHELQVMNAQLNHDLRDIRYQLQKNESHAAVTGLADGRLLVLLASTDPLNASQIGRWMDEFNLGLRARRALRKAKIRDVHEITESRLSGIPGCGITTINELLLFKQRVAHRMATDGNVPEETNGAPVTRIEERVGETDPVSGIGESPLDTGGGSEITGHDDHGSGTV